MSQLLQITYILQVSSILLVENILTVQRGRNDYLNAYNNQRIYYNKRGICNKLDSTIVPNNSFKSKKDVL